MKKVRFIIFRYLTNSDFFNIYKPAGTEERGGGQTYIDFPTQDISLEEWGTFFEGANSIVCDTGEQGPIWYVPINSIGTDETQEVKIYQRREQSICITSQKLTSARENRVKAWHPKYGFPQPSDAKLRNQLPQNLVVFLIRTEDDEFWAGWSQNNSPSKDLEAKKLLQEFEGNEHEEGFSKLIQCSSPLYIDTDSISTPFTTSI